MNSEDQETDDKCKREQAASRRPVLLQKLWSEKTIRGGNSGQRTIESIALCFSPSLSAGSPAAWTASATVNRKGAKRKSESYARSGRAVGNTKYLGLFLACERCRTS